MTDHQPVHEQVRVQDQTDHGPRRTPGRYQRSPRGTMKCRPVIVAIVPGIPKPVLETGVEYAKAMGSKIVNCVPRPGSLASATQPPCNG